MNKWTLKSLAAAAVGVIAFAGQANAAVSYSYTAEQSDYVVAPGAAVTVKLYLLETLTAGSPSRLAAEDGLASAGIKVSRTSGQATITSYNYNDATGAPNAPSQQGFGGGPPILDPVTPTTAQFTEAIGVTDQHGVPRGNTGGGLTGGTSASYPDRVFLGSVTLQAQAAAGSSAFAVGAYPGAANNTFTLLGNDIDQNSPNWTGVGQTTTPFTITVVPEPAFAGLAVVVGGLTTLVRRRRTA